MTDSEVESDLSTRVDEGAGKTAALGLGERLRSARKAKALSLERVSEVLHLDETLILALEDEQFESLGAPVFVRGHLRAYARLLELPVDSIVAAYHVSAPSSRAMPTVGHRVDRSVTINPVMWGSCGLLLLLGLILAWYVTQDDAPASPSVDNSPAAEMSATSVDVLPIEQLSPATDTATPPARIAVKQAELAGASAPVAAESALPAEPIVTSAATSQPAADTIRLSLSFNEESWVEISDANRRLLFGLQRAGRSRDLAGEPPFQLLIGNASGVDLRVNGEMYPMPGTGRAGQVARFEIQGSER